MCGISGIFVTGDDSAADYIPANRLMVEHHRPRGPDARGIWDGERCLMGHTRLSIIDPDNEQSNQPMHTDRWVLVFNGEIYNYRSLRKDLRDKFDYSFRTDSDSEVLLAHIHCCGINKTIESINGIFAFAAYDKKEHCLYLIRDRMGIKPLYYFKDGNTLWFSSTPAAIVLGSGKKFELDRTALYKFFSLGAPVSRETLFRGIDRVSPAGKVTIDKSMEMDVRCYWKPEPRDANLEETLHEAVTGQKEAHVPSSVFLSGGVDSSVVSLYLEDVDCFHLNSPERQYAEYFAGFLKKDLKVSDYAHNLKFDEYNSAYVRSSGEPSASAPIPFLVAEAMHQSGYKVAFSANGADELFFGYPRTPAPGLKDCNLPANNYESGPAGDGDFQIRHIFRDANNFTVPLLDQEPQSDWILENVDSLDSEFSPDARFRWLELQTYVQYDLNPTLDFASMACSLEVRVPFLDHVLIESALSTDVNEFFAPDYGRKAPLKKILKKAGTHPLLWSRPKIGFSIPPELVQDRKAVLAGIVSELETEGYLKLTEHCESGSRDQQYLYSAAHAFHVWKRHWIDSGLVSV